MKIFHHQRSLILIVSIACFFAATLAASRQLNSRNSVVHKQQADVRQGTTTATALPAPTCAPTPAGMVAWYPAENNANDIVGGNNGTLQGGATFAPGKVGQAFSLNGTDAFVRAPNTATVDLTTAGSLDAWVKFIQLPSVAEQSMQIVGVDRASSGNAFSLQAEISNRFRFSVADERPLRSTTVIQTGVWYHVAGAWDATGTRIYVNGVLEASDSQQNVTRNPSGDPVEIGHQPTFNQSTFFNGLIDEVEIFNRALSDAEVLAIFNAGTAGKCAPTATPTPTPAANTVQFSALNYNVNEGCTGAIVTVTRSGDTSTTATVDFATSDGPAEQRTDYTIGSGTLTFAAGQTSQTFGVLVGKDAYLEGNETLNVSLSKVTGGASLGTPTLATVTVIDDTTVPTSSQPIDNPATFVCQHYHDFLAREPDPGGAAFWTGLITQCGNDQGCIRNKRIDVSNAFYYELEFQQTGAYVYRLYRAAYGNSQPFPNPDDSNAQEAAKLPSYVAFAFDRARVVGGGSLAQGQADFADAFVKRAEFVSLYQVTLSGSGFVDGILLTLNDVGVDLSSQRQALIDLFNQSGGGNAGRGAVLYRLADDNTQTNPINNRAFIDAEYNRAFVVTQYFGYLRRDPDIGGFLFWLGQVNSAPLRDTSKQHSMVCAFLTSTEYQQRFSSVVTHSNGECSP